MAAILARAKERQRQRQRQVEAAEPPRPVQIDLDAQCDPDTLRALEEDFVASDSSMDDLDDLPVFEDMQHSDDTADDTERSGDADQLDMSLDRTLNQLDRESTCLPHLTPQPRV